MEPLSGHLLIAGTSLLDANFRRAVVLIGHHDGEGAVGVVLNRKGVDWDHVADWLERSWRTVAPKRLTKLIAAAEAF